MVGVEHVLLINTGVSSVVLFVLLLFWAKKPVENKEDRVYLTKDMYKIKEHVNESEVEI